MDASAPIHAFLKEFEADKFKFDENGRKFTQTGRKHWEKEKLLVMSNFSFSQSAFKRLVLQTRKNQGLFGKELTSIPHNILSKPLAAFPHNHCRNNGQWRARN